MERRQSENNGSTAGNSSSSSPAGTPRESPIVLSESDDDAAEMPTRPQRARGSRRQPQMPPNMFMFGSPAERVFSHGMPQAHALEQLHALLGMQPEIAPARRRVRTRRSGGQSDSDMSVDSSPVVSPFPEDEWLTAVHHAIQPESPNRFERPEAYLEAFSDLLDEFTTKYGQEMPSFYPGSFTEALETARTTNKLLMVYLHNGSVDGVDDFCMSVLTNEHALTLMNMNMIVWGWDVTKPGHARELQRVFSRYFSDMGMPFGMPDEYPFVAILSTSGRLHPVEMISGVVGLDDFVMRLLGAIDSHDKERAQAAALQEERRQREELVKQQDEAFMEAVEENRLREERERQEEEERLMREQEEERLKEEKQREEDAKQQMLEEEIERLRASLPEEAPAGSPNVVTVQFRVPDGSKIQRRFLQTDRLQSLVDFMTMHRFPPSEYHLQTNFPKRLLNSMDLSLSLQEAGLSSQEAIFVQLR